MGTPIEQKPLYLEVAGRLRERIYAQGLKPGEWIDEKAMCQELGISRTPLRAIRDVLGDAVEVRHARALETTRSRSTAGFGDAIAAALEP